MTNYEGQSGEWAAPSPHADAPAPVPPYASPAPTYAPAPAAPGYAAPPPAPGYAAPAPAAPGYAAPPPAPGYAAPPPAPGYAAPPPAPGYAAPNYHPPTQAGYTSAPSAASSLTFRSWQPGIVALRPLPFHEFLTVPFKAMRFNRAVMIGGPLLAFTVTALVASAAVWLLFTDDRLRLLSYDDAGGGVEPETVIVSIAAIVLAIVADLVAGAVIYPGIGKAMLGEKLSLRDAISSVWPRLGWLLLLSVLMIGSILLIVVGFVILMAATQSTDSDLFLAAYTAGNIFAQIAQVAWALAVTPLIAMAKGVIVMERKNTFAAIARAFRLIRGRFWWSVLIMLVIGMIAAFMFYALLFVGIVVGAVGFAIAPDQEIIAIALVVISVLVYVAGAVITNYSFSGGVGVLIYLDQRMRKEGLAIDLARAAEATHQSRTYVIG